jgi:nucleoside permease NupC
LFFEQGLHFFMVLSLILFAISLNSKCRYRMALQTLELQLVFFTAFSKIVFSFEILNCIVKWIGYKIYFIS